MPRLRTRLSLVLALACLAMLPGAALAIPPANDGYLQSIAVNRAGTTLTEETVRDSRDTREATVQADLFSPPSSGGGVERTDCRATRYGATVWYDFHPNADGVARIFAAGFDAAVSVHEFDPATSRLGTRVDCSNEPGTNEELFVNVQRRKAYTIQIGGTDAGLGPATGTLDLTFEYLSDRDGDGELDALDRCPDVAGTSNGCPQELRALPTLRAFPTPRGIRISSLSVDAPRGARVQVRCRRGCRFSQARTAVRAGPLRFARLRNRRLPAGAQLEIFVTRRRAIGSYFRYTVTRGNFRRVARCLPPSSLVPRTRCR